ncbi:MAG: hypothetical protein EOO48_08645 [Flavobacterium sp.]|nr:MAG: hypothetical protein EOO48_08645 [Flavobacterium sp.]
MKELQYLNKYFVKYKYHFLIGIITTVAAQFFNLVPAKLISESIKVIESFQKAKLSATDAKEQLIYKMEQIIVGEAM